MPQNKRTFSDRANCYAFAVKCKYPGGKGTAKPGGATSTGDVNTYFNALKQGVLTDGGNKVRFFSDHLV
ncbi:MAG TPA: hypothetical protein VFW00_07540, partial [Rhodocyclaceae bacterium]|nr:hypothetical protein [Rhodocyclaceae bacterium]